MSELKQALNALGVQLTDQEARQMFSAIDVDRNYRGKFDDVLSSSIAVFILGNGGTISPIDKLNTSHM
jgi:Ca2+-binding EF-hand superfamily protein